MKINLKAIADGVNEHKDELLLHAAVAEIKTVINDGHLLEAAKRGEYSYTVLLSEPPKFKFVKQIEAEIGELGLDCTYFICMHRLIKSVTIKWD